MKRYFSDDLAPIAYGLGFVGGLAFLLAHSNGWMNWLAFVVVGCTSFLSTSSLAELLLLEPPNGKGRSISAKWMVVEVLRIWMPIVLSIGIILLVWFGLLLRNVSAERNSVDRQLYSELANRPAGSSSSAFAAILNKAQDDTARAANDPSPLSGYSWWLIPLVLGAIIAFAIVVRKHPSSAPIVGVIPLAIAAVEHSEKLSKYCGIPFFTVAFLMLIGVILLFERPSFGKHFLHALLASKFGLNSKEENQKEKLFSWPMSGFSLLILLWTFVVVCYGKDCSPSHSPESELPCKTSSCDQTASPHTVLVPPRLLSPRPYFASGKSAPLRNVAPQLLREIGKDDLLLLIGSTDCEKFKGGNNQLANDRQQALRNQLQDLPGGLKIESLEIPQPSYCGEAPDLRTVFPVLIPIHAGNQ